MPTSYFDGEDPAVAGGHILGFQKPQLSSPPPSFHPYQTSCLHLPSEFEPRSTGSASDPHGMYWAEPRLDFSPTWLLGQLPWWSKQTQNFIQRPWSMSGLRKSSLSSILHPNAHMALCKSRKLLFLLKNTVADALGGCSISHHLSVTNVKLPAPVVVLRPLFLCSWLKCRGIKSPQEQPPASPLPCSPSPCSPSPLRHAFHVTSSTMEVLLPQWKLLPHPCLSLYSPTKGSFISQVNNYTQILRWKCSVG